MLAGARAITPKSKEAPLRNAQSGHEDALTKAQLGIWSIRGPFKRRSSLPTA